MRILRRLIVVVFIWGCLPASAIHARLGCGARFLTIALASTLGRPDPIVNILHD
jgi:hypothetical protein